MGIYSIKSEFQRVLQPLVAFLVRRHVSPDWLTAGAIVVAGGVGTALTLAPTSSAWLWLTALGVGIRLTLNALDGEVARGLGCANRWGEVKNELGDRIADALIFGALVLVPYVPLAVSLLALVVSLLLGYVGILSKAVGGHREYGGVMGKPDRMAAVAISSILVALTSQWVWFSIALLGVVVLGILSLVQRLEAIRGRC